MKRRRVGQVEKKIVPRIGSALLRSNSIAGHKMAEQHSKLPAHLIKKGHNFGPPYVQIYKDECNAVCKYVNVTIHIIFLYTNKSQ